MTEWFSALSGDDECGVATISAPEESWHERVTPLMLGEKNW